jgi:hypothetical protein
MSGGVGQPNQCHHRSNQRSTPVLWADFNFPARRALSIVSQMRYFCKFLIYPVPKLPAFRP